MLIAKILVIDIYKITKMWYNVDNDMNLRLISIIFFLLGGLAMFNKLKRHFSKNVSIYLVILSIITFLQGVITSVVYLFSVDALRFKAGFGYAGQVEIGPILFYFPHFLKALPIVIPTILLYLIGACIIFGYAKTIKSKQNDDELPKL